MFMIKMGQITMVTDVSAARRSKLGGLLHAYYHIDINQLFQT